jgi:hypothetical protein
MYFERQESDDKCLNKKSGELFRDEELTSDTVPAHGFVNVFFVSPYIDFETVIVDLDVGIIFFLIKFVFIFARHPKLFFIFKCSDDDSSVRTDRNTFRYTFKFAPPKRARVFDVLVYLVPALATFKICDSPSLWLTKVENFSFATITSTVALESRRVFDVLYNRIFLFNKHVSFIL